MVQFILTGGEVHDVTQAPALLNDVEPQAVLADKAYDANALIDCIESKNAKVVIPPKANRKEQRDYDQFQYRNRNLIERFFAKIKQFRRVATLYYKLDTRFASFITLAASMIGLK